MVRPSNEINVSVPIYSRISLQRLAELISELSIKSQIEFIKELDFLNSETEFTVQLIKLADELKQELKEEDDDYESYELG